MFPITPLLPPKTPLKRHANATHILGTHHSSAALSYPHCLLAGERQTRIPSKAGCVGHQGIPPPATLPEDGTAGVSPEDAGQRATGVGRGECVSGRGIPGSEPGQAFRSRQRDGVRILQITLTYLDSRSRGSLAQAKQGIPMWMGSPVAVSNFRVR